MNLCNYAKVIIARSTKDINTIQWLNKINIENEIKVHPNELSSKVRNDIYHTYMECYPKMHISYEKFKYLVPRIQRYLTNSKYYKNGNKSGEKVKFLEHYSLQNWCKLSECTKKSHQLNECSACEYNTEHSVLHQSASRKCLELTELSQQIVQKCTEFKASPGTENTTKNAEHVLEVIEPVIQNTFKIHLKDIVCKKYKLTPKLTSQEKHKKQVQLLRENKNKMTEVLEKNDDITDFLSSSKSYTQYNNERLDTYFVSKQTAKQNLEKRFSLEKSHLRKPKTNTGQFSSYLFDKSSFLKEVQALPSHKTVSWTALGLFRPNKPVLTRHLKFWHDHSDILNRTYFCIMVSCLYDTNTYIINEEYNIKNTNQKPMDVQYLVEKPRMYIFGQSKSSDLEQMSYTQTRVIDIDSLKVPSKTKGGTEINNIVRIFTGDNPARQFEAGQQRGGNYSCICGLHVKDHQNLTTAMNQQTMNIDERLAHFKAGYLWETFSLANINVFQNLIKETLIQELNRRNIEFDDETKCGLQTILNETLHGIVRPSALLCVSQTNTNLDQYEISSCEPLHDITNVVQNLLTELPHHIGSEDVKKLYTNFCNLLIGEKNQIKGSDARLFAIKLALFTRTRYELGQVNADILTICNTLVDIIHICYSPARERSPKMILRMYNQCFLFSVLVMHVIGTPKKVSSRKFYGAHFHSMVTHFPEMYRIFCLRSLIPEDEERTFGNLRSLAERTTNRQASYVVDTCMLRYLARENKNERFESFSKQESIISKQAHLLPPMTGSVIPSAILSRQALWQAHCMRIADFLEVGQNVWWCCDDGNLRFFDGPDDKVDEGFGPQIHDFGSHSLKDEYKHLNSAWERCIDNMQKKKIMIPIKKIKLYRNGRLSQIIDTFFSLENKTNEQDSHESSICTLPSNEDCSDGSRSEWTKERSPHIIDNGLSTNNEINHDGVKGLPELTAIRLQGANDNNGLSTNKDVNHEGVGGLPELTAVGQKTSNVLLLDRQEPTLSGTVSADHVVHDTDRDKLAKQTGEMKRVKRKLFQKEECSHKGAKKAMTEMDMIQILLQDSPEVAAFKNARHKHLRCPLSKSIEQAMDQCFAIIQTNISKKHNCYKTLLEQTPNNKELLYKKGLAEKLMDGWKFYYY